MSGFRLWADLLRMDVADVPVEDKAEYVTGELLPILRNDLRVVAESGCHIHGCGSGPNFTLALLSMVASEVVGALSAPPGVRGIQATRLFLQRVGDIVGDQRYGNCAGLLIAFFRNGIAHSFLPKQRRTVRARTIWANTCLVDVENGTRDSELFDLRRIKHLTFFQVEPGVRAFDVVTKILYLDIDAAIKEFAARLSSRDQATMSDFSVGFDRWFSEGGEVKRGSLLPHELAVLDGEAVG